MWAQFHTLVTHELKAILELLAFVVARKRLKPDLAVFDVLLLVDGQISTRLFFKPLLGTQTQTGPVVVAPVSWKPSQVRGRIRCSNTRWIAARSLWSGRR